MGRTEERRLRRKLRKHRQAKKKVEDGGGEDDLDPSKPLKPLTAYSRRREELLVQAFASVKGDALDEIIPAALKHLKLSHLKKAAEEELLVMSKKRLRYALEGRAMSGSSEEDESESEPSEGEEEEEQFLAPFHQPPPQPTAAEPDSTTTAVPDEEAEDRVEPGLEAAYPGPELDFDLDAPEAPPPQASEGLDLDSLLKLNPRRDSSSSSSSSGDDSDDEDSEVELRQKAPAADKSSTDSEEEEMARRRDEEEAKMDEAVVEKEPTMAEPEKMEEEEAKSPARKEAETSKIAAPEETGAQSDSDDGLALVPAKQAVLDLATVEKAADEVDSEEEDAERMGLALPRKAASKYVPPASADGEFTIPDRVERRGRLTAKDPRMFDPPERSGPHGTTHLGHMEQPRFVAYQVRAGEDKSAFRSKMSAQEARAFAKRPSGHAEPLPKGPERFSLAEAAAETGMELPPEEAEKPPSVEEEEEEAEPQPASEIVITDEVAPKDPNEGEVETVAAWPPPKESRKDRRKRKVESLDKLLSMVAGAGALPQVDDSDEDDDEDEEDEPMGKGLLESSDDEAGQEEKGSEDGEVGGYESDDEGGGDLDVELAGLSGVREEGPAPRPDGFRSRTPSDGGEEEEEEEFLSDDEGAGPFAPGAKRTGRKIKRRDTRQRPVTTASAQLSKWEELAPAPLGQPDLGPEDSGTAADAAVNLAQWEDEGADRSGASSPVEVELRPEDDPLFGMEAEAGGVVERARSPVERPSIAHLKALLEKEEAAGRTGKGMPAAQATPRAPPGVAATPDIRGGGGDEGDSDSEGGFGDASAPGVEHWDSDEDVAARNLSDVEEGEERPEPEDTVPGFEPRSKRAIPGLPLLPQEKEKKAKVSIVPAKALYEQLKKEKAAKEKKKVTATVIGPETRDGFGLQPEAGRSAPADKAARLKAEGPALPDPDWQAEEDAAVEEEKERRKQAPIELTPEFLAELEAKKAAHEAAMEAKKAKLESLIAAKESVLQREAEAKRRLEEQEAIKKAALASYKKHQKEAKTKKDKGDRGRKRRRDSSGSSSSSVDSGSDFSSLTPTSGSSLDSDSSRSSSSSSSSSSSASSKSRSPKRRRRRRRSSPSPRRRRDRRSRSPRRSRREEGGPPPREMWPGGPAPLPPGLRPERHGYAGWGGGDARMRGAYRGGRGGPTRAESRIKEAFGVEQRQGREESQTPRGSQPPPRYDDRPPPPQQPPPPMWGSRVTRAGTYDRRHRQRDWSAWDDDRYQEDTEAGTEMDWAGGVAKMDTEPPPRHSSRAPSARGSRPPTSRDEAASSRRHRSRDSSSQRPRSRDDSSRRRREEPEIEEVRMEEEVRYEDLAAERRARKIAKAEMRRKERGATAEVSSTTQGDPARRVVAPPKATKAAKDSTAKTAKDPAASASDERLEIHELEMRRRAIKALMGKDKEK